MEILIIGAGAAGLKAASRARRRNEEAKITVIDAAKRISFARCGLPYFVGGVIHEIEELRKTTYGVLRDESYFKKLLNIDVLTETKAVEIDRKRKVVKVSNGKDDELNYDYLVIATGAKPIDFGLKNERVLNLFDPEDAEKIIEFWENGAESAIVIGASFIGLEACEALKMLDLNVTLLELQNQVAPVFDADMAKFVEQHLKEKGVNVFLGKKVEKIVSKEKVKVIAGEEFEADFAILAVGLKPNVDLAAKAGIEIGESGAIKVNEFLQTNDEFIYAGGDCVENLHLVSGRRVFAPFGDVANKHGRIIGDNITGGRSRFPGIVGTSIVKVFDITAAKTGLSEKEALALGFRARSVVLNSFDKTHYYPNSAAIRMKLVFDESGRILGAQLIGNQGVDKRIDVIATAIFARMTIDDLANLDLAYAPPYAPALDPVIVGANVAKNKLNGILESKRELKGLILDVRSKEEVAKKKNALNALNIPLLELRERMNELPKDKEIVTICPLGLRAYMAMRILKQHGFKAKAFEGGMAFI